jgi:hypothetical protein
MQFRRRGGRKVIIGDTRPALLKKPSPQDSRHKTILKALGRAYRWKRMLESGEFASVTDLAKAEKINHSYVRRILRLSLLSPAITGAILDGPLPKERQLEDYLKPFPDEWMEQEVRFR